MKKLVAALLAGSLLLLTACGTAKQTETATTDSAQITAATTRDPLLPSGKAADASLLPEGFPPLPENCVNLSVSNLSGTGGRSGHALHRTRIAFDCYEPVFYAFTNQLIAQGYTGACKNIRNAKALAEGFLGGWQNGEHVLVIVSSEKNLDSSYRITLDYQEYEPCFPQILAPFYPAFEAAACSRGDYYGYNLDRATMVRSFSGTLDDPLWQWQFKGTDAFVGVTMEQFSGFIKAMESDGFFGDVIQSTADGCTLYAAKIYKHTADGNFGAFMDYNETTQMLDLVLSNDLEYYLGPDWESRPTTLPAEQS